MELSNLKEIVKDLTSIQKRIPYFIDMTDVDSKKVFDIIHHTISIFKECCQSKILNPKYLDELSTIYYTNLIMIYNLKTDITNEALEYISDIYERLMEDMQEMELYEAANNLYKITNLGI